LEVVGKRQVHQIVELLETKEECVPLLKELRVYYTLYYLIGNFEQLKLAAKGAGVKLIEVVGRLFSIMD
jgi:hypothetical protein